MTKTAIVIPYNTQDSMTLECLQRLQDTIKGDDVFVILVHGYVDDRETIFHPFVDKVVKIKNESYCKTINAGLKEIPEDCDRVFIMGNDSFPQSDNWLPELEKLYMKYELVLLSPDYTQGGKRCITGENEDLWYHSMLPSIHYYMHKDVLDKVGLMDERFVGACYYSDDDYCMRINQLFTNGIARAKNVVFDHRMSAEGKALGVTGQMLVNEQIFKEKWKR